MMIDADHRAQIDGYGFVKSGTKSVSIALWACLVSSGFSLMATRLALGELWRMASPRPKGRFLEVAVMATPLFVAVCYLVFHW